MKIHIYGIGSRGDVQPTLALAKGLQAAGHEVALVASVDFADWVRSHGVTFIPIDMNMQQIVGSELGRSWIESGRNPLEEFRNLRRVLELSADEITPGLLETARGADVLVSGFTSGVFLAPVAEKLGVRHISAALQPTQPTRAGWGNFFAVRPQDYTAPNLMGSFVFRHVMWWVGKDRANQYREELGLQPQDRRAYMDTWLAVPQVLGVSRHVLPRPDDYPPHVKIAGYWFLDEPEYTPPDDLQAFLDAGPPPVYVGFGSMAQGDPRHITELIFEALDQSGSRGIVYKGWAGLGADEVPETVYLLDGAPHSWLFPRMAGVVHHGGAGTTAAALRAGVPSTVVPHFSDQPYWGRRVHELGVGAAPIPRQKLSADNLAAAMHQMRTSSGMQQQARLLSEKIRAEDGIAEGVRLVEALAESPAALPTG